MMIAARAARRLLALLAAAVALAAAAVALAAAGEISPLSYDDFKQEVSGSDAMWLLSFHSPECFACEDFVPQLQDVAGSVAQWGIRIGSVDCTEHKRVCEDANVVTVPAFKFYASPSQRNPYTHKRYRVPVDYTGKLEGKALERFLLKNMHHSVQRVKTVDEFAELYDKAKQAGRNVAVLFTQRDQTSPLYKAASNAFAGRLDFAEVHSSINTLVEKYGVEALPTLGVVSTANNQFHKFDGDGKDLDAIKVFLADYATKPEPAADSDGPLKISADQLQSKLQRNKGAYVLAITENGSTDDIPSWDKIVKNCKGSVHAAVVTCGGDAAPADSETGALCDRFRSEGSFLVAVPYSSRAVDSTFARGDADKAYHAAIDSLPNKVAVVTDTTVDNFLVGAHKSNKLAVLLVTNKDAPTAFMKDLAVTVQEFAETAMLSGASQETLSRLQIPKTPAIMCTLPVAIPTQTADGTVAETLHVVPYSGPTDVADVAAFVRAIFQRSRFADAQHDSTSSHTTSGQGAAASAQAYEQVTAENWDRLCPDGASAVCAIAMVNGEEDGEVQAAVLANAMQKLGPSASTAFKFMWADAACLQSFADALDVQPHKLPTVVAFSPLRLRSAQLIGAYDERNVKQFLEGVLHGSIATGPLSERPIPDAQCASHQELEAEAAEELEDVDDLLAEIRREEEAAKKRLQQELEEDRKRKAQEAEEERKKAEAAAAASSTTTTKKTKKSSKKKKSSSKKNSEL